MHRKTEAKNNPDDCLKKKYKKTATQNKTTSTVSVLQTKSTKLEIAKETSCAKAYLNIS